MSATTHATRREYPSDIAFTPAVKTIQNQKGSRGSYARMERGLGMLGTERIPSETPFEYLARVLERLSVSEEAAQRLTDLFERAKFSPAPVDEAMKAEAVAALEAIKEEARAWAA